MKKKNSGFTLVELLAVIVILATIITIASSSVIAIMNKARKNMAREVRNNLAETALTYATENSYLEKCSVEFSKEVYENNNIANLNNNTSCFKRVTVVELKNEGLFEDARGFCNNDDIVIVYRYNDGVNSEYKTYVSENACNN